MIPILPPPHIPITYLPTILDIKALLPIQVMIIELASAGGANVSEPYLGRLRFEVMFMWKKDMQQS